MRSQPLTKETVPLSESKEPLIEKEDDDWLEINTSHIFDDETSSALPTSFIKETEELRFLTLNVACLPLIKLGVWPFQYVKQINGDFLKDNIDRIYFITNSILMWNQHLLASIHHYLTSELIGLNSKATTLINQYLVGPAHTYESMFPAGPCVEKINISPPDVISLQEAFDPEARQLLIDRLAPYYPYHTGADDRRDHFWQFTGSGLLILSRYKILDVDFRCFSVKLPGEETASNKGWLAIKIDKDGEIITIYNTHLPGGGAIFKWLMQKILGTASAIRGYAMGEIYHHAAEEKWSHKPLPQSIQLPNSDIVVMTGDVNTKVNDKRCFECKSTGMSANGFKEGEEKYHGQKLLLNDFCRYTRPENFIEMRKIPTIDHKKLPHEKIKKIIDKSALEKAKKEGYFTGTSLRKSLLKSSAPVTPQDTEGRIIDAALINKDAQATLHSEIISFGKATDHFGVMGTLRYNKKISFFAPKENIPLQETTQIEPIKTL